MRTRPPSLPVVSALVLSMIACRLFAPTPVTPTVVPSPTATLTPLPPTTGMLIVEIQYTGQWYRETFNYQPGAANIRHVVLAMPVDSTIQVKGAGWAFSNLKFTPSPEPLAMNDIAVEFIPVLDFMYDAPGGVASIELTPGEYNVAVAFIAAALPPPGGDVILYPGVTGGGASNDFQVVEIVAGETLRLSVILTDANGWGWLGILASK